MSDRFPFAIPVFMSLILLISGCTSSSNGPPTPADKIQASVQADWIQYQRSNGLPGGGLIVYIETPAGNYVASCGMPVGVDQNSHFRIASNTKTFTASAIMLLYQQGLLDIDHTIVTTMPGKLIPYVPDTPDYNIPNKANITIKQLLSHTAGVFDVTNDAVPASCPAPYAGQSYTDYVLETEPNHQFSPTELVGVDALCHASYFVPGADYKYSNQGYSILATIIERVSGLTYDQYVHQNLVTLNGLTSTFIPMLGTDQTIPAPFTPGYVWFEGLFLDRTISNMSLNIAEGNIISTPVDLARWIKRLLKAQAGLNAATVSAMETLTPQSVAKGSKYGLGLSYMDGLGYGHTGAHEGYLSLMAYDAAADVTTIAYFNVWDYANLLTAQANLLMQAAKNARAAVGY
ncbi:MAG: D-alanyl-D-alanine carboxypeptidase precursor [Syntrophaceae bacterium PtaU1.Bin231]|nr:MAG: D-alanyl-D-alanine carboxypeptidase precursor [Syntrophaceae bacterium PtaU1.Bin231]